MPGEIPTSSLVDSDKVPPWGDVLLAIFLLVILSVVFFLDSSAYFHQQKQGMPIADFPLMRPRSSVFIGKSEFLPVQVDATVRLENFSPANDLHPPSRLALGPINIIEVYSSRVRAHINFTYYNLVPDQEITICCNEKVLEHFISLPVGVVTRSYPLDLREGSNRFTILYARYNHCGASINLADTRLIAGSFTALDLFLD